MSKRLKLENLTKSSIWSVTDHELGQMLADARLHDTPPDEMHHYMNIIRPAFDVRYLNSKDTELAEQLELEHYDLTVIPEKKDNANGVKDGKEKTAEKGKEKQEEGEKKEEKKEEKKDKDKIDMVAVRKHEIRKVTDLTMENVQHLTASEVLTLIDRNLGTGWDGLSLTIQDIILSAFFVDSSTMPEPTLHRKGGLVQRRKADGYDVLEIPRGGWIEAIFLKSKPKQEKVRFSSGVNSYGEGDEVKDNDEEDLDDDDNLPDDDMMEVDDREDSDNEEPEEEGSFEDLDVVDEDSMPDAFDEPEE